MKKFILFIFLFSLSFSHSQIKKGESVYGAINISSDPYAIYKEGGINISFEYEKVERLAYVKAGAEFFPVLDGGYNFFYTGAGFNLKIGHFDNWRLFSGVKAGAVLRGSHSYGNYGGEAGVNYIFPNGAILGLKTDAIYRSDFLYWNGDPEFVGSGYITLAFKIDKKSKSQIVK